jgi:hypothetical protein
MARGRAEEEAAPGGVVHGQPSGLSELRRARLGLEAKPLPGRSGHGGAAMAARTPHRRRSYSSCMSSSARRLRRKGYGGTTLISRRRTYLKKKRAAKAKRKERERKLINASQTPVRAPV